MQVVAGGQQASQGATPSQDEMPTVLLVDDEPDILASFGSFLDMTLGWHVLTAESGPTALRILEKQPVDLVVSDYRMPGMDGLELLRRVRDRTPQIPTVMVTAYPDPALEEEALAGGVTRFLSKLTDPDELAREVQRAYEGHGDNGPQQGPPEGSQARGHGNRLRHGAHHGGDDSESARARRPGRRR